MQQGLGPDVGVEAGGGAAQLGQSEPQPQELGLVPHEQRHGVPGPEPRAPQQRLRGPVAQLIRLPVRERIILEEHEVFVRLSLNQLQEAIQHGEVGPHVLQDATSVSEPGEDMEEVLEEGSPAEEEEEEEKKWGKKPEEHDGGAGGADLCLRGRPVRTWELQNFIAMIKEGRRSTEGGGGGGARTVIRGKKAISDSLKRNPQNAGFVWSTTENLFEVI